MMIHLLTVQNGCPNLLPPASLKGLVVLRSSIYVVIVDQYSGSSEVAVVVCTRKKNHSKRTNCLSQLLHLGMTPLKKYATRQFQDAVVRHAAIPQGDNCDHMEFEIQNVCNLICTFRYLANRYIFTIDF